MLVRIVRLFSARRASALTHRSQARRTVLVISIMDAAAPKGAPVAALDDAPRHALFDVRRAGLAVVEISRDDVKLGVRTDLRGRVCCCISAFHVTALLRGRWVSRAVRGTGILKFLGGQLSGLTPTLLLRSDDFRLSGMA